MLQIHPNVRTAPAIRAEIARSTEPSGTLARRFGVSSETIRNWRKRGSSDCLDHSARPHKLPWKATDEEHIITVVPPGSGQRQVFRCSSFRKPSLADECYYCSC